MISILINAILLLVMVTIAIFNYPISLPFFMGSIITATFLLTVNIICFIKKIL